MSALYSCGQPPAAVVAAVRVFGAAEGKLQAASMSRVEQALEVVGEELAADGWEVSAGSRDKHGVALGEVGSGAVRCDARYPPGIALWIEFDPAWKNNKVLRHLIEAALFPQVTDVVVAVPGSFKGASIFELCESFLKDVQAAPRISLPFSSLTLIGF